jgi:hypothetical protein
MSWVDRSVTRNSPSPVRAMTAIPPTWPSSRRSSPRSGSRSPISSAHPTGRALRRRHAAGRRRRPSPPPSHLAELLGQARRNAESVRGAGMAHRRVHQRRTPAPAGHLRRGWSRCSARHHAGGRGRVRGAGVPGFHRRPGVGLRPAGVRAPLRAGGDRHEPVPGAHLGRAPRRPSRSRSGWGEWPSAGRKAASAWHSPIGELWR